MPREAKHGHDKPHERINDYGERLLFDRGKHEHDRPDNADHGYADGQFPKDGSGWRFLFADWHGEYLHFA
jgi:hypothetical protein